MAKDPMSGFEIPAEMRNMAEQSVDQAKKAFDGFMSAAQQAVAAVEGQTAAAQAGAKDVGFRQGRLAVSPIELDSRGAKALRARLPEAIYESGRSTVTLRISDEAAARFAGLVAAAEAILEVATEPAPDDGENPSQTGGEPLT